MPRPNARPSGRGPAASGADDGAGVGDDVMTGGGGVVTTGVCSVVFVVVVVVVVVSTGGGGGCGGGPGCAEAIPPTPAVKASTRNFNLISILRVMAWAVGDHTKPRSRSATSSTSSR